MYKPSTSAVITDHTMSLKRVQMARNYAEADRSDPFAYSRAMTHMRNGVASFRQHDDSIGGKDPRVGEDAFYSAEYVRGTNPPQFVSRQRP